MRFRFFYIISLVLIAVAASTGYLHSYIIHRERLEFIDQQVRVTAATLLSSQLAEPRRVNIREAEEIISDELGESRIGKFFILRGGANGSVLFESSSAKLLPIKEVPQSPTWITINDKGYFIRVLNLALPRVPNRTLQVGLILEEQLVSPSIFSSSSIAFFAVILPLGLLLSFFLTSTLLQPIYRLSKIISEYSSNSALAKEIPHIDPQQVGARNPLPLRRDEFMQLLHGFNILIDKINRGYRLTKFWSYQMAHELKTPLAVIEAEIDLAVGDKQIQAGPADSVKLEIGRMADTISSFLDWAEIENQKGTGILHSIRISKMVLSLQERLQKKYGSRLIVDTRNDFTFIANLQHAEQLLKNLIVNALMYSPVDSRVTVIIDSGVVEIIDLGPGLPDSVRERLGEPFNQGKTTEAMKNGHGLGLAYVMSLARHYNWRIEFKYDQNSSGVGANRLILDFNQAVYEDLNQPPSAQPVLS